MGRRIAALLLALTILVSVIPAGVFAEDDHIYDIGETIWVTGIGNRPTAKTVENGYWEESIGPDGEQIKQPGCTKEIHEHTPDECWDAVYGLICEKEEHTARMHNLVCQFLESKYQWYVKAKENSGDPGSGGGGSGGGDLESDGSGQNDPEGYINFEITNLDSENQPMAGFQYGLFGWNGETLSYLQNENLRLELQKKLEQRQLEQQEKIKELQELGDDAALDAYLKEINAENEKAVAEMNAQNDALLSKITNESGKAYFRAVEKYLSESNQVEGAAKPTWRMLLLQAQAPLGYKPRKLVWEVTIVRNSENDYSVETKPLVSEKETYRDATEDDFYEGEGYANGVFTFVNRKMDLKMMLLVEFVDEAGERIPDSVTKDVSASITVTSSEGYQETASFPVADAVVEQQKWQQNLPKKDQPNLEAGTYTVAGTPQYSGDVDGYEFISCDWNIYPSGNRNETPVKEILLGDTYTAASVVLTAVYRSLEPVETETTEPTESVTPGKYTIIAQSVDKKGDPISSGDFTLLPNVPSTVITEKSGNEYRFVIDTATCPAGRYTLTETKAPDGYLRNEDQYIITVDENGDVEISKDTFIRRFFARDCDAEEVIVFRHDPIQVKTGLTCHVSAKVSSRCTNAQSAKKEFEARTHQFELTWFLPEGEEKSETISLKNGETKQFKTIIPYGAEYSITPLNSEEFNYSFTGENEGIFDGVPLSLDVNIEYIVELSEDRDLDLYFTKVDSSSKKPLANASFVLTDPDDKRIGVYTTQKDGAVDVENLIYTTGLYTLTETKAPDQYDAIRKPIEIYAIVGYEPVHRNGKNIMEEKLVEDEAIILKHKSVVKGKDGTYWIKNTASGDNPKTGDDFQMQLWTGLMAFSMLGLLTAAAGIRRKRRRN